MKWIHVFAVTLLTMALCATCGLVCHAQETPPNPLADPAAPAIVTLSSGCSGVCISSSGHILTAKHCETPETSEVYFPLLNKRFAARRLYVARETEGPCLLQCQQAADLPHLTVAAELPRVGDEVDAWGYHAADARNLVHLTGRLTGVEDVTYRGQRVRMNVVSVQGFAGMSGGPLLRQGQIVGLLHAANQADSVWIGHTAIRAACQFAQIAPSTAPRPPLIVFGRHDCQPCQLFVADHRAGRYPTVDVTYISRTDGGWQDKTGGDAAGLVAECETATGQRITTLPTFWVRGAKSVKVGYAESDRAGGLLQWITSVFRGLGQLLFGSPAPTQVYVPEPPSLGTPQAQPFARDSVPLDRPPTPTPAAEPIPPLPVTPLPAGQTVHDALADWTDNEVYLLMPRMITAEVEGQERTWLQYGTEQVIGLAQQYGVPAAQRHLREFAPNVLFDVVFEAAEPDRFAGLIAAAGIARPTKPVVIATLAKQFPLAKAAAANVLNLFFGTKIEDKLRAARIEVVTERFESGTFHAVREAARIRAPPQAADSDWLTGLIGTLYVGFRTWRKQQEAA